MESISIKECCVLYDGYSTILLLKVMFNSYFNKIYETTILLPKNTKIQYIKNIVYIEDTQLSIDSLPQGIINFDENSIRAYGIKISYPGIVGFDSDATSTFFFDSDQKCVIEIHNWTEI